MFYEDFLGKIHTFLRHPNIISIPGLFIKSFFSRSLNAINIFLLERVKFRYVNHLLCWLEHLTPSFLFIHLHTMMMTSVFLQPPDGAHRLTVPP